VTIPKRLEIEEIITTAQTIWPNKALSKKIAFDALELLSQTYARKFVFYNGKSAKHLIGGLFYLLGYRYNAVKKQRELADILGTSDVTIRKAYRGWLETFPDLFLDVIAKFMDDNEMKYYVLLDLKPKMVTLQR
jgi:transcription initiation factor TFIIIB Brf1 subunit/transcription initiation factor TFIIB